MTTLINLTLLAGLEPYPQWRVNSQAIEDLGAAGFAECVERRPDGGYWKRTERGDELLGIKRPEPSWALRVMQDQQRVSALMDEQAEAYRRSKEEK